METRDVNFPSSAKKRSFFEVIEEFKFEMKQMVDFLGLSNPKNSKVVGSHILKMSEFLEEILNEHLGLLSRFEQFKSQHFLELKELKISLKNQNKQKKTGLKLRIHQMEGLIESLRQELEQKNKSFAELRTVLEENLQKGKKLQRTMEAWFKRQLQKLEMSLKEASQAIIPQTLRQILQKIQKYSSNFPWKPSHSLDFSIATTPFSNYSVISPDSELKSAEKSGSRLNKAFYLVSSQKKMNEDSHLKTPKTKYRETTTVTQNEELLLKLIKDTRTEETDFLSNHRHSVKLEDILNVTKKSHSDSSVCCDFLREVEKKDKPALNSLEKLLKTKDFTGKMVEKKEKNHESALTNKNVIKDLNREVYQHLGESLNLSQSSVKTSKESLDFSSGKKKKAVFKENFKKVPKLNLEKIVNKEKDESNRHSFSPSYRKNAERSQYLKEILAEKQQIPAKRVKQTNKSLDLSGSGVGKPSNVHSIQSRINEKTNKFMHNLLQNPRKHVKNNYSLIENPNKEELSFLANRNNIRINDLLRKNDGSHQTLTDKANFLNIVAPTNNINVYISNEFEKKTDGKPKKKNGSLMRLLSQVNQSRKEGRLMKENQGEGEVSLANLKEFALFQKMRGGTKKQNL